LNDEVEIYSSLYFFLQVNFIRKLYIFSYSKVWVRVFWTKSISQQQLSYYMFIALGSQSGIQKLRHANLLLVVRVHLVLVRPLLVRSLLERAQLERAVLERAHMERALLGRALLERALLESSLLGRDLLVRALL
jgi:uncharacterized protein YjbI with pentapeptide repeats